MEKIDWEGALHFTAYAVLGDDKRDCPRKGYTTYAEVENYYLEPFSELFDALDNIDQSHIDIIEKNILIAQNKKNKTKRKAEFIKAKDDVEQAKFAVEKANIALKEAENNLDKFSLEETNLFNKEIDDARQELENRKERIYYQRSYIVEYTNKI